MMARSSSSIVVPHHHTACFAGLAYQVLSTELWIIDIPQVGAGKLHAALAGHDIPQAIAGQDQEFVL